MLDLIDLLEDEVTAGKISPKEFVGILRKPTSLVARHFQEDIFEQSLPAR
jgi:hypothetical protein